QKLIRTACAECNNLSLGEFTYFNAEALQTLKTEHGVELRNFPDDVMTRVNEISLDVRSKAGSGGDLERRIYESFEANLKSMSEWGAISDGPYYAARRLGG
ncbi:MAG: ABC transporter substrate-binding protein, partial [Pseudomonadota bacterium]